MLNSVLKTRNSVLQTTKFVFKRMNFADPGGGATGDATFLINAMLAAGPYEPLSACFGFIVDPEAVTLATAAGVGSVLPTLLLGGKMDPSGMHGAPLELKNVEVMGLTDGRFTLTAFSPGWETNLGPMAHLCVDGLEILVSTLRSQTFCPAVFSSVSQV